MKYILLPVWGIILVAFMLYELLFFALIFVASFLWRFKVSDLPKWSGFCTYDDYLNDRTYFDKTPIETFTRRLTFGEYKHFK